MKPWQYITSGIAIICTGMMLATNVLAAYQGTDDGVQRWIMTSVSIAADLGLIGFMFAMVHHHIHGRIMMVFLSLLMWIACGVYTGVSSMRWLEGQFNTAIAPAQQKEQEIEAKREFIAAQIVREEQHLKAAYAATLNGRNRYIRTSAKEEVGKSQKRIASLEAQRWETISEPVPSISVKHTFIGYEWLFPLGALFASQVAWFVTFGHIGHGRTTGEPEPIHPDRETNSKTDLKPHATLETNKNQSEPAKETVKQTNVIPWRPPAGPGLDLAHQVMELVGSGYSERTIAARFDVPRSQIQRIKREARANVLTVAE